MNCVGKPSLEHIALVKVAATLWQQCDITNSIKNVNTRLSNEELKENWLKIEARVVSKIKMLPIFKSIYTEKISSFVRTVGNQILKWIEYHYGGNGFSVPLPNEFCWTSQGTINIKKTAEVLSKDKTIDITMRYKLACVLSLEDFVPKLWEEIPEDSITLFYNEEDPKKVQQHVLVIFWTYIVKKGITKLKKVVDFRLRPGCSPYRYALEISAREGNSVATAYFFEKLTVTEITESLVPLANSVAALLSRMDINNLGFSKEYHPEILLFFMAKMNQDQQKEVLESYSFLILRLLLNWPLQDCFIETTKLTWSFLTRDLYGQLLLVITKKIIDGEIYFDYKALFGTYWQNSPTAYKKYVATQSSVNCHILLNLYKVYDLRNVNLFFQGTTLQEKREIIYTDGARNICEVLMDEEKYDLIKYFIEECLPRKSDVMNLKRSFEEHTLWNDSIFNREDKKWDKFISVLNDICESKKRKYVED